MSYHNAIPLYKGRWLIALYDEETGEELEAVAMNADEMADMIGCPTFYSSLSHMLNDGDRRHVMANGTACVPYLIDAFESDIGNTLDEFRDDWKNVWDNDTKTVFHLLGGRSVERTLGFEGEHYGGWKVWKARSTMGILSIWLTRRGL